MALSYSFDASKGESPDTLAARRKSADLIMARMLGRPPQNLGEGINALGQGWLAGRIRDDADEKMAAGNATGADAYSKIVNAMSGGAVAPIASAPMGALPGAMAPSASTAGKIYNNNEPSPMDPPSGVDRQNMIATILGEAVGEPQIGKDAVASVIRTRAVDGGYGGDTPTGVVTAKNQFEPWNTPEGRAKMAQYAANPQNVAAADQAIASAYGEGGKAPNDPTEGMTHFYSPKEQGKLGRAAPAWAGGESVKIGTHVFNSPDDAAPYKVAGPATAAPQDPGALPPNAQPAQGTLPTAQAVQGSTGPSLQQLMQAASNPWLNEGQRSIVQTMLKQKLEEQQQAADPLRQAQIKLTTAKAQKATDGSDTEYGLNPIYGKDAEGNDVLGTLGKDGTFKKIDTQGVKLNSGIEKIDLGTSYQLRDKRTGQIVGTEQKDLRGAEREKGIGEGQGKSLAAAPGDIQAGQNAIETLDKIVNHPYIDRGTGITSKLNGIPGTGGYDFQNLVDQAKSGAFLQAIQQMRGLGSLSNAEGGTATAAVNRMNTATSKEAFIDAANDYRKIVKQGIDRAQSRLANPSAVNPPSTAPRKTSSGVSWSVE